MIERRDVRVETIFKRYFERILNLRFKIRIYLYGKSSCWSKHSNKQNMTTYSRKSLDYKKNLSCVRSKDININISDNTDKWQLCFRIKKMFEKKVVQFSPNPHILVGDGRKTMRWNSRLLLVVNSRSTYSITIIRNTCNVEASRRVCKLSKELISE